MTPREFPKATGAPARPEAPAGDAASPTTPSEQLAERIARIALEKKAEDVLIMDLRSLVGFTDFFVLASGRSDRQARAVAEAVREQLKAAGVVPARVEGERDARWILLDYLDCVVHVFTPEAREYYRLEHLWAEAPVRRFD